MTDSSKPQAAFLQRVDVTFDVLFEGDHADFGNTTHDQLSERAIEEVLGRLPADLGTAIHEIKASRSVAGSRYFHPGEEQPVGPLSISLKVLR